jgi:hypothetical protein
VSIVGIILLFFRSRPVARKFKDQVLPPPTKLFAQVITKAIPEILNLWEHGDRFISKQGINCPEEILDKSGVGRSYYQCQPHFWQCYWDKGIVANPLIKIDIFGQTFHVSAKASFAPIPFYSEKSRFYEMLRRPRPGLNLHYGYVVDLEVKELPGLSQPMILTDSCRDTYLPQRLYTFGKAPKKNEQEFLWDNFDRHIFIDRFYVSNQQVNEWRLLRGDLSRLVMDRSLWYQPAVLSLEDQKNYCHFFGKRLLEASLFDAATMAPADTQEKFPAKMLHPQTPWMRDLSKSFLGMARINPDYQLSPLDCQLAQVKGCAQDKFFATDSASWMGMYFALGFYPESLRNPIHPSKNLKLSSKFLPPSSEWHELGVLSKWSGVPGEEQLPPVAFRCYEEVSL